MDFYMLAPKVRATVVAIVDAMLAGSNLPQDQWPLNEVPGPELDFVIGQALHDRSHGRLTLHSIDGRLVTPFTLGVMVVAPVGWRVDPDDPDGCRRAIVGNFAYRRMGLQFVRCALVQSSTWNNFIARTSTSRNRTQLGKDGENEVQARAEAIFAQLLEAAGAPGVRADVRSLALHFLRLTPTMGRCWAVAKILGGTLNITVSFND